MSSPLKNKDVLAYNKSILFCSVCVCVRVCLALDLQARSFFHFYQACVFAAASLLWCLYCGVFPAASLLWNLCCGVFPAASLMWHLYQSSLVRCFYCSVFTAASLLCTYCVSHLFHWKCGGGIQTSNSKPNLYPTVGFLLLLIKDDKIRLHPPQKLKS